VIDVVPVPPLATAIVVPFHVPDVTVPTAELPATLKSVPINNFLAIAAPLAIVRPPPLVAEVASVVLDIANPPANVTAPVVLLVLAVESLDIIFGSVKVFAL
jgi:hypothetical protein